MIAIRSAGYSPTTDSYSRKSPARASDEGWEIASSKWIDQGCKIVRSDPIRYDMIRSGEGEVK
ncbi:GD13114 [Drosophila simulans]|uniref:GD13114 n=1 Tax=Drosophila simulans TaxID=7240 RepID=B4QJT2_DROSI|nr:GD13114 [Drosophila simulans]